MNNYTLAVNLLLETLNTKPSLRLKFLARASYCWYYPKCITRLVDQAGHCCLLVYRENFLKNIGNKRPQLLILDIHDFYNFVDVEFAIENNI